MKIPAKEEEPENEVRGKRKNTRTEKIVTAVKGGKIFKEGVVNISYAVKCCKTREVYIGLAVWRSPVTSVRTVSVLDHTTLRSE